MKTSVLFACALLSAASAAVAQDAAGAPFFPPFGYDQSAFDRTGEPGDDFFEYANGEYLARAQIPADRVSASRRFEMTDRTEAQLMRSSRGGHGSGGGTPDVKGKVGAFYAAYMDEAQSRRSVPAPRARTRRHPCRTRLAALATLMGRTAILSDSPFGLASTATSSSRKSTPPISARAVRLPDRDYYLKPDFAGAARRIRETSDPARPRRLVGSGEAAQRSLAFETSLAESELDPGPATRPTTNTTR